ncbi:ECF-type sigma factor [Luteimonas aquatica]|uniref:ECF-type sigma factor n=1 Tax=Luteimonas aquatica TaxID=450364 RepID=UPI001F59B4C1|nr:ECF-type sigma factor [Luteimonas aquatica]
MLPESASDPGEITQLLRDWRRGSADAQDRLFNRVYRELKGIALRRIARSGVRLVDATELVNEAMLRLLASVPDSRDREHFFRIAAAAIRCTLVDIVRHGCAEKRGAGQAPVSLALADGEPVTGGQWLEVEEALRELERQDERKCRIVEMALLLGLEQTEIAEAMAVSLSTVERDLRFARAWLRERLSP